MSLWERAIVVFFSIDSRAWVEWVEKKVQRQIDGIWILRLLFKPSSLLCLLCCVIFSMKLKGRRNGRGGKSTEKWETLISSFDVIFFLLLDYKDLNKSNHLSLDICQSECRSHSITQCCFSSFFISFALIHAKGRLRWVENCRNFARSFSCRLHGVCARLASLSFRVVSNNVISFYCICWQVIYFILFKDR